MNKFSIAKQQIYSTLLGIRRKYRGRAKKGEIRFNVEYDGRKLFDVGLSGKALTMVVEGTEKEFNAVAQELTSEILLRMVCSNSISL